MKTVLSSLFLMVSKSIEFKSVIFAAPEPEVTEDPVDEEIAEDPIDEELEEDSVDDDPADEIVTPAKQNIPEKSVQKPTSSQPQRPEPRGTPANF